DELAKITAEKSIAFAHQSRTTAARRDFIATNRETIDALRNAEVKVQVEPDAGAGMWASFSGWSIERVQMIQSAGTAFLLIILSMVCFQAAGFFFNPFAWMRSVTVSGSTKGGSGGGSDSGE